MTHLARVQRGKVWFSVRSEDPVPPGEVLAIVARKVQMVLGMMRSRINDAVLGDEVAVMDRDGPHVDEDKHAEVDELVHREEEGVNVVRCALRKAVQRVEGMRGPWGGHLPQVVLLVDRAVENGPVEGTVDPINTEVGEHEERAYAEKLEGHAALEPVIEFRIAAYLVPEDDGGQEAHYGDAPSGRQNFAVHLVWNHLGVLEIRFVKEKEPARHAVHL